MVSNKETKYHYKITTNIETILCYEQLYQRIFHKSITEYQRLKLKLNFILER